MKTFDDKGRKQIDAITNQIEKLAALFNKNVKKFYDKEIFE